VNSLGDQPHDLIDEPALVERRIEPHQPLPVGNPVATGLDPFRRTAQGLGESGNVAWFGELAVASGAHRIDQPAGTARDHRYSAELGLDRDESLRLGKRRHRDEIEAAEKRAELPPCHRPREPVVSPWRSLREQSFQLGAKRPAPGPGGTNRHPLLVELHERPSQLPATLLRREAADETDVQGFTRSALPRRPERPSSATRTGLGSTITRARTDGSDRTRRAKASEPTSTRSTARYARGVAQR